MTRYDNVKMDPVSGMAEHPLAGVPQKALDAATQALQEAALEGGAGELVLDTDDVDAVAHAVLMAALEAMKT